MKRNGLLLVIVAIIAVFTALSLSSLAFAVELQKGEWKCDWSIPGFSGNIWITVKLVENETVKGEVQVTGSTLVSYEKFTGKLDGNTLTILLQSSSMSLTIENGEIIGGVGYGTRSNDIPSCFKMK